LVDSLWESKKILKRFKPDVVIGTGGFAGPLLKNGKSDGYSYSDSRTKFISWNY
jgi:UDP-N-acetylglucosamine--N-acetylmuramyl-(pentapeptide) pyrophosphoryl-undecaprenol N-acetylglucosamine transferase